MFYLICFVAVASSPRDLDLRAKIVDGNHKGIARFFFAFFSPQLKLLYAPVGKDFGMFLIFELYVFSKCVNVYQTEYLTYI